MKREELAQRVAQAIALVGTRRECCKECGKPLDVKSREDDIHTPHSAARALGINEQNVYRAMRKAGLLPPANPGPAPETQTREKQLSEPQPPRDS